MKEARWMRQTKSLNQTYISKRDSSEVICGGSPTQKVYTEKVEGDSAGEAEEDGSGCAASIDADPLIGEEEAGGA